MADISISDVSKHVDRVEVLHGIDLEIAHGSSAVLLGAPGCGKSTLLRLIAGLEAPSAGRVLVGRPGPDPGVCRMLKPEDGVAALARELLSLPDALLFDDPLAAVEAAERPAFAHEVRSALVAGGVTSVHATHDAAAAMVLADQLVVMRAGRIEQAGPPQEVYDRPGTIYVAEMVGSPAMNFLAARLDDAGSVVLPDGVALTLPKPPPLAPGAAVTLGVRPEGLRIAKEGTGLRGTFDFAEDLGAVRLFHFEVGGRRVTMRSGEPCDLFPGDTLTLAVAPSAMHLFDPATERRIEVMA